MKQEIIGTLKYIDIIGIYHALIYFYESEN